MKNIDELIIEAFLNDKAVFKKDNMVVSIGFCGKPKRISISVQQTKGDYAGMGCAVNSVEEAKSTIRRNYLRLSGTPFPESDPEERAWFVQLLNHKYYPIGVGTAQPELMECDGYYALDLQMGWYPELDFDRDEQNPDIIYIPKNAIWDITDNPRG